MVDSLSFGESLMTSLTGITVVFSVLVILALATIVIAKVVSMFAKTHNTPVAAGPAVASAPVVQSDAEEDLSDVVAVLQGAVSMESGIPVDKLVITSIKSVPDKRTDQ